MCVIFLSYRQRDDFPLVIAANRDEFYERPTARAMRWSDFPFITAGRDLVANGTWLGVTDRGRFAAVTNYRDPGQPKGSRSRGDLVADFLRSDADAEVFFSGIVEINEEFTGFNLLAGQLTNETDEVFYYSNQIDKPRKLEPGVYGLSNALLDTPWPKVADGKAKFEELLGESEVDEKKLFELLSDRTFAPDELLPETGIGLERERLLSPIRIETPIYGTRSSTIITIDSEFKPSLKEHTIR